MAEHRLTIRLDAALYAQLAACGSQGQPLAAIVRQALLEYVPPPRWTPPKQHGRPSHALKRLIERWCGDHG
jgi:hypothetical protein